MKVKAWIRIAGYETHDYTVELVLPDDFAKKIKEDYETTEPPRVRQEMSFAEYVADDLEQNLEIIEVKFIE